MRRHRLEIAKQQESLFHNWLRSVNRSLNHCFFSSEDGNVFRKKDEGTNKQLNSACDLAGKLVSREVIS